MKSLITVAITLAAFSVSLPSSALTVTQWNFNSTPDDGSAATGTLTPNIGSGTASLVGGTTATFASGDANGGSSDPLTGTPTNDSGWNISTFPTINANDKTAGVQFAVSTVGLSNIIINYDLRHSNSSSRFEQFQYSLNGTTFIDSTLFDGNAGDTWFNNRTVDLSSITAANNNANFVFRVVSTFAPSTSSYAPSSTAYATNGTWRFDQVTLGTVTPVPFEFSPAVGVVILGGLFVGTKTYKSLKK
jgi:hypothetical protein